jgi:streptogramin lyase
MRRSSAIVLAVACAAILGWVALALADQPTAKVAIYPIHGGASGPSGPTVGPVDIAAGSDGRLWFTESGPPQDAVGQIAGISTSGKIIEPAGATGLTGPATIAPGVGGTMWFTEPRTDGSVDQLTLSTGTVTPSGRWPEDLHDPGGVAVDARGDVWATVTGDSTFVAELVPPYDGEWKPVALAAGAKPGSIVLGPDGSMWFTEAGAGKVATITTGASPTVTEYPTSGTLPPGALGNLVVGLDGNLWVGVSGSGGASMATFGAGLPLVSAATAFDQPALLRIAPAGGGVTLFYLPSGSTADPDVLAVGPDKQLWMPDLPGTDGGLTAFATTDGTFTRYPAIVPAPDTISSIISDPSADSLWLTDQTADAIDNVPLTPPVTDTPPATTTSTSTTTTSTSTTAPPLLTPALLAVSGVSKSGATLSGRISEPAGSPSTSVSYSFQYGTSTAYGSSTPVATITATAAGVSVGAELTGLQPYNTYHYRLSADDCAASECVSVSPDQTFTTGSTLQPELNTDVGATTVSGHVLIELRGKHSFVSLSGGELIPLGATVDARHGTVLIQSATATAPGELASGRFSGGIFTLTQPRGGTGTVLGLTSDFKACVAKPQAHSAVAAVKKKKKKKSKKVVNQVFGNAHGQFSTRGHYATAADQGTRWRTADRCDGTLIAVTAGRVTVTDRVHHRTFVLNAGHHYLAATG